MMEPASSDAVVFVVDDVSSVRTALKALFESVGLQVKTFASGAELIEGAFPDAPCCIVLDVRLPVMSGLKFQEELLKAEVHVPIVFITAHGEISMAVKAMKAGAVDFLTKPFKDQELLDAVFTALERDRTRRAENESIASLREHFDSLSAREREVLSQVATGRLNKQIAADLGVSEVMVKVHRASGMRKMQAKSLAELIKMMERLRTNAL